MGSCSHADVDVKFRSRQAQAQRLFFSRGFQYLI
jgi:hypothetical protein